VLGLSVGVGRDLEGHGCEHDGDGDGRRPAEEEHRAREAEPTQEHQPRDRAGLDLGLAGVFAANPALELALLLLLLAGLVVAGFVVRLVVHAEQRGRVDLVVGLRGRDVGGLVVVGDPQLVENDVPGAHGNVA